MIGVIKNEYIIKNEYVENKFGAMLNAFKFGAPPHAGCAFGLDRIFMILMGEDNIREVVAFPKNGSGVDVMMSSPSFVEDDQLKELKIKTIEDEEESNNYYSYCFVNTFWV